MLEAAGPGDGKPSQFDGKKQDEHRSQREVRERQAEQTDYADGAIVPAVSALGGADARRNRKQHRDHQRCDGQLQRIRIALRNQASYILVVTQRQAQVAVQHAFPVIEVLRTQWEIKSIGVTGGLNIRRGSAFAEHLLNGIAGNQVDKKKDQRNDEPDDRQSVEHAEGDVAEHGCSSIVSSQSPRAIYCGPAPSGTQSPVWRMAAGARFSILTFAMRWPSMSSTVKRRPSKSNESPG